jgi:hypothetical protein
LLIFAPKLQDDMETNDTMTANEPVAAYGTNSYADVMYFLHTMKISPEVKEKVGLRLVLEVRGKYLSKAFALLDHLAALDQDWDGNGAPPISRRVLNNVKSVLAISDDVDWKEWMIGPDTNATLGLQSKSTMACISIGAEDYSYFAEMDGKEYSGDHLKFTPESLLSTMRTLA